MSDKLTKWRRLTMAQLQAQKESDTHAKCPECREQIYFCDCPAWLAQELMEQRYLTKEERQ